MLFWFSLNLSTTGTQQLVEKQENKVINYGLRAQGVAEQSVVLAVKPEDLNLIPKTHMVEELTPDCCPLSYMGTHTHTQTQQLYVNRESCESCYHDP